MIKNKTSILIFLLVLILYGCSPQNTRPLTGPKGPPPVTDHPVRAVSEIIANMVQIPAGEFWMGCDSSKPKESCNLIEMPLHRVYLNEYYIDRTEVTVAQYTACLKTGACTKPLRTYSDQHPNYFNDPQFGNYPVIFITWFQARDYCTWAGKRLPSEAEWEKAARGRGSTRIYPWGNSSPDCSTTNIKVKWTNCVGDTRPVGSYPKDTSLYGAVDMAGNVREWINDWYDPGFYKVSPYKNPTGPAKGMYVVMRGSRFDNTWPTARVASRRTIGPNDYGAGIGFRCAYTRPH